VRLSRIFKDDSKAVIFAMDHGFERGPIAFNENSMDPNWILSKIVEAGFDAAMINKGAALRTSHIWRGKLGFILKTSGKTELREKQEQDLQSPVGSVEEAISLGADAVATTIYWGSRYEDLMLERLAKASRICEESGMPLIQLAYPRVQSGNNYDVEIVSYAARAAFETGASAIKTYYTGSEETFSKVVKAASGVPVLLSGGQMTDDPMDFLRVVESVMAAGGSGVVVGRNVFQHKNPVGMGKAIIEVVHEGWRAEKASKLID
jgi:fructose-bisphosphate aldolase, class I